MSNPINDLLRARQASLVRVSELNKTLAEENKKLSKIDADLATRLEKLAKAFGETTSPASSDSKRAAGPAMSADGVALRKSKGSYLSDPVREILHSAERALTTRELYEELTKREIKVGGKRPLGNLSAHLSNVEGVAREGQGWALKGDAHAVQ